MSAENLFVPGVAFDGADRPPNLRQWLETQARIYGLTYLLAHADDGVVWGRFTDDGLVTADAVWSQMAQLRLPTLQQCRAFGKVAELLLWPASRGWQARLIEEPPGENVTIRHWSGDAASGDWQQPADADAVADLAVEPIDEAQILWGDWGDDKGGFTLLTDGKQGLRHAVPLTGIQFNGARPVRLLVRHYVAYDTEGTARIALSRLCDLRADAYKGEPDTLVFADSGSHIMR